MHRCAEVWPPTRACGTTDLVSPKMDAGLAVKLARHLHYGCAQPVSRTEVVLRGFCWLQRALGEVVDFKRLALCRYGRPLRRYETPRHATLECSKIRAINAPLFSRCLGTWVRYLGTYLSTIPTILRKKRQRRTYLSCQDIQESHQ